MAAVSLRMTATSCLLSELSGGERTFKRGQRRGRGGHFDRTKTSGVVQPEDTASQYTLLQTGLNKFARITPETDI